jgi:hypothetical protein
MNAAKVNYPKGNFTFYDLTEANPDITSLVLQRMLLTDNRCEKVKGHTQTGAEGRKPSFWRIKGR